MKNSRGSGILGTLFRCEIRMLLRDTRTILIAVVAPLIMFPGYILLMRYVESREENALREETYTYAVSGSEADWAMELAQAAIAWERSHPDTTRGLVTFELQTPADPEAALRNGDLHLVVEGLRPGEWDSIRQEGAEQAETEEGIDEAPGEPVSVGVPVVRLLYRAQSDFSREARNRMNESIMEVRVSQRDSAYRAAGFPVAMEDVAEVETESVASAAKASGAFLGIAMTPFLVLLMLSGGSIVAVDALSGEKERGTLETLLTTAASRTDIVRAKLLAVIVVGLAVAVINVSNLLVYVVLGILDLPANFALEVSPVGLLFLMVQFIPVAVLVAAALLLLSGASKSYKEYQVSFFPVLLAFAAPSFAAALPGIDLHSVVAFLPLAGVAVAVREILVGEIDVPFQLFAFVSTGGLALWLTFKTQETLSNEKLISGSDLDEADLTGGAALFPRHVFRWFLGLWVVFFLVSLWFGQNMQIRGQVILNLGIIFSGGGLIMIRRYRLDPREALALRKPHPLAWIAAILGAPSALILGAGLAEVVNTFVFPVPEQLREGFTQELLGPELPLWQLLLFFSLMPGIIEELLFRGILVYGLRKRVKQRWLLALIVGLVFGMFHVSLFRIAPTAWLGFVLTWVVLLGGSIYPAMLWHALNNAIAILAERFPWLADGIEPQAWWTFPAAVALGISLWILWKTRPWASPP